MFTQKEMTKEHRESSTRCSTICTGVMSTAIAKGRGKSTDEVKKLIDNAPYNARQAKEAGLIDGAMYREEAREGNQEAAWLQRQ